MRGPRRCRPRHRLIQAVCCAPGMAEPTCPHTAWQAGAYRAGIGGCGGEKAAARCLVRGTQCVVMAGAKGGRVASVGKNQ